MDFKTQQWTKKTDEIIDRNKIKEFTYLHIKLIQLP